MRYRVKRLVGRLRALLNHLKGKPVLIDSTLKQFLSNETATGKPTIIVTFHVDDMYSIIKLADTCTGFNTVFTSQKQKRNLNFLSKIIMNNPEKLKFDTTISSNLFKNFKSGSCRFIFYGDTTVFAKSQSHHIYFDRVHRVSADWAILAKRIGANVVAIVPVNKRGVVYVKSKVIPINNSIQTLIYEANNFLEETVKSASIWQFYTPNLNLENGSLNSLLKTEPDLLMSLSATEPAFARIINSNSIG